MMPVLSMGAMVLVAGVSTAFGLERTLRSLKICSVINEHILDHAIRPNAKHLLSNFSRQMPISKMPRKARQLIGIFMSDFDHELRRSLNPEPSTIFKLQSISLSHGNGLGEVKQDIFTLIASQANPTSMAGVKIESD